MKSLVSIIEIPTADFARAREFYQNLLKVAIEEAEMGDNKLGLFPAEEGSLTVMLINGSEYKPSSTGVVIYLNAGDDLQVILDRIEPNKGKILVPKTEISPEMGFFAMFTDTEGNRMGLFSMK